MISILIDPLHCLMLNLPKVVWKYVFGDRMTNEQRELVAEYLTSVRCPLDVRAKGDGRDANRKWFTGEVFQRFVEGDSHSPGLAENIKAIMDIIYVKAPAPVPTDSAAAVGNKTARNGGGGAKKRQGGYTLPTTAAAAAAPAAAAPAAAAPSPAAPPPAAPAPAAPADVSPADDSPIDAKLRERYGSHMDVVKLGLEAWKEIGMLYAEWREPINF